MSRLPALFFCQPFPLFFTAAATAAALFPTRWSFALYNSQPSVSIVAQLLWTRWRAKPDKVLHSSACFEASSELGAGLWFWSWVCLGPSAAARALPRAVLYGSRLDGAGPHVARTAGAWCSRTAAAARGCGFCGYPAQGLGLAARVSCTLLMRIFFCFWTWGRICSWVGLHTTRLFSRRITLDVNCIAVVFAAHGLGDWLLFFLFLLEREERA